MLPAISLWAGQREKGSGGKLILPACLPCSHPALRGLLQHGRRFHVCALLTFAHTSPFVWDALTSSTRKNFQDPTPTISCQSLPHAPEGDLQSPASVQLNLFICVIVFSTPQGNYVLPRRRKKRKNMPLLPTHHESLKAGAVGVLLAFCAWHRAWCSLQV